MNFKNAKVRKAPDAGLAATLIKVALLGGAGVYSALNSPYNVDGGHRAIVFNRIDGIKEKVYPEGTHLIIPWFERPIMYDVHAHPHLVESTSGSCDLQMVYFKLWHSYCCRCEDGRKGCNLCEKTALIKPPTF